MVAAFVNVRDYGATGDGTTDDTAAFKAARDAAPGGWVHVPAGTYATPGLTLSLPQMWTLTPGATVKGTGTGPVVTVTADGVTLDGGTITGGGYGILANSRNGLTLRGVTVTGCASDGIHLSGTSRATLDGCTVTGCGPAGNRKQIVIDDLAGSYHRIRVTGCTLDGTSSSNGGIAVQSVTAGNTATDVKVTGNTVTIGANAAPVLGIEFYSNNGGTITASHVSGNDIFGPGGVGPGYGISLGGVATTTTSGNNGVEVRGNTVTGCGAAAAIELIGRDLIATGNILRNSGHISISSVDVAGGATGIVATGNTTRGCTNPNYAIQLNASAANPIVGAVVDQNIIEAPSGVGVTITGPFLDGSASGNTIRKPGGSGIIVNSGATVTGSRITGNRVNLTGSPAGSIGINIAAAAADLNVDDNTVTAAPSYGIRTSVAVSRVALRRNTVTGCGSHGIFTQGGGDRFTLAENTVHDNAGRGISLSGSPTLTSMFGNTAYANTGGDVVTSGTFATTS